jgi:hypothetical protein
VIFPTQFIRSSLFRKFSDPVIRQIEIIAVPPHELIDHQNSSSLIAVAEYVTTGNEEKITGRIVG